MVLIQYSKYIWMREKGYQTDIDDFNNFIFEKEKEKREKKTNGGGHTYTRCMLRVRRIYNHIKSRGGYFTNKKKRDSDLSILASAMNLVTTKKKHILLSQMYNVPMQLLQSEKFPRRARSGRTYYF